MLQRLHLANVVVALAVCTLSMSNRALADSQVIIASAWGMSAELPVGWTAVADDAEAQGKAGTAQSVTQFCNYIAAQNSRTNQSKGLGDFEAVQLPEGRGGFVAYTIHIPKDRAYFDTAIQYMNAQVATANEQGAGIKINKNEVVGVGRSSFLRTDLSYGNGVRIVMMDCWFEEMLDKVGRIQITLLPIATDADRQAMEGVLSSLLAELPFPKNVTIGPLTMYVPSEWKAADSDAIAAARSELTPQVAGGFQTFSAAGAAASLGDLKVFNRGGGNMVIAYTVAVTLADQADYLQSLQNAQAGQVNQIRAQMTSAESHRGHINGVDVVRLAMVDANGAQRTIVQQWDASNPSVVTIVSTNVASDASAGTPAEAVRMIRSISRAR